MSEATADPVLSLRRHALASVGVAAVLVLGILGWGGAAQISGAVIAPGQLTVENSVKQVQHKEGGIVRAILVKNGDAVEQGELLARLDVTIPQASLNIVQNQFYELSAQRLRLIAERDGLRALPQPAQPVDPALAAKLPAEEMLLRSKQALLGQEREQLRQQIRQLDDQVNGFEAQMTSSSKQSEFIAGELVGIRSLHGKGLAPLSRLNALEREAERLNGERGALTASIAQARTRQAEVKVQLVQLDSEHLATILAELKDVEMKLAQLSEQRVTSADQVKRGEIRAPSDGVVQALAVHTVGGVMAPGEVLMSIVPQRDALVVEARIAPEQVDQVAVGSPARIRLTSFSTAATPIARGTVSRLSADAQTDDRTGARYYLARLLIADDPASTSLRDRLVPGMPAEVHIETTMRSALSYLAKPLADQFNRVFVAD